MVVQVKGSDSHSITDWEYTASDKRRKTIWMMCYWKSMFNVHLSHVTITVREHNLKYFKLSQVKNEYTMNVRPYLISMKLR